MSLIVSRARSTPLPNLLAWRALGFRTICSGRLSLAPSSPYSPAPAVIKILESFKEEFEVGSGVITLETGKIARFANGSVVLGMDETKVLSTVTCAKSKSPGDFLPLTVDYQEKLYAQGLIPNTYMRREGAPKERELLCGRLIDRPIRPLFPSGFYHEVQIMASVLSLDGKQDPDILAANAASAALMLSDVPWGGPIGVVRLGRIDGQIVVNPTMDELSSSDLSLIYACTRDKTMMIDVQAREITEKDLAAALRLAHPEAVKYIDPQIRLAAKAGKQKKEYKLSMLSEKTLEKVAELAATRIESIFTDPSKGRLATLKYTNDALRSLIGPMAALKRKIEEETGARLYFDDGTLTIVAKNQAVMDKAQEKVDFIIGREIVVGGVYKGTVTSIKEYGAFVEFNGGQQGLLHMSELSHEPVSKVSDVLHIGKYITMMCIDTDVRGNIKLSLKALLPKPEPKPASGPEKVPVVKDTVSVETSSLGETVASLHSVVEPPQKSKLAVPAVVIRTAVECDEAEKSSLVEKNAKPKRAATMKPDRKLKSTASKQTVTQKEEEVFKSTGPEETMANYGETLKKPSRKKKQSGDEAGESASVSARKLKIGTEMTAKVHQVRTHGLVLDLGGGIRGMYKFEGEEETEFEIGDALQVKCTSFTTKGIPVMALVDDEEL
ncbi:hypothetical protein DY000_02000596 [Brassica cretica]|uniref:polyribonucleotide nucleotidyltransferase n=1 Tax=Brassica cretica TaxID=69181 RepID=A0ABQ7C6N1_BRACR|nr:hypothetical protein DY000_02000596 [Brassica cretica]